MNFLPPSLERLVQGLKRLPGVGSRNAERMALALLRTPQNWPEELASAIEAARKLVKPCSICGFHAEGDKICTVCADPARDATVICVVETANDVTPIERANAYRGRYHCLGGKLSPLDGVGPESLTINALLNRLRAGGVTEVILALGTDVEGETTGLYLAEQMQGVGVKVTRLAQGMPMGGSLDSADSVTLGRALQERRGV